jgi:hypothetical protein
MTYRASSTAAEEEERFPPLSAVRLAEANINPLTGLATDYLNHFNEAIMLLEILPVDPACLEDFVSWRPLTYAEHFAASHFKDREIAIAAYESADPAAREHLDMLADMMNEVLGATREKLQKASAEHSPDELAARATRWLKPLVARAGAVINGIEFPAGTADAADEPQAMIDAVMGR